MATVYGLSPKGFAIKTLAQIQLELQQAFQAAFGAGIDVTGNCADRLDDLLRNGGPSKPNGDPEASTATPTKAADVSKVPSGRPPMVSSIAPPRDVIVPFRRRAQ